MLQRSFDSSSKSYIMLKHSTNKSKSYSITLSSRKVFQKKCLITRLSPTQLQSILNFLTLAELLVLYLALKGYRSGQLQKSIIRYIMCKKRIYSYRQQRQFMDTILTRRKKAKNHYHKERMSWYSQVISQDVDRTSYTNFTPQQSVIMKEYLRNILVSLSNCYFKIGYVQGLNCIVKVMYANKYSQLQTFHYMSYFLTQMNVEALYLPDSYKIIELCYVLQTYLFNYLPDLYFHLKKLDARIELFAASWFITLFSQQLAPRIVNKIWNLFLIKGWKILIKFSLAVLFAFENQIRKKQQDQIFPFMRNLLLKITQSNQTVIWQMMHSLKVTNKMVNLLSRQMKQVDGDTQIQLWRISEYKAQTEQIQCTNIYPTTPSSRIKYKSSKVINPGFPIRFCCDKLSLQKEKVENNSFFRFCQDNQSNN